MCCDVMCKCAARGIVGCRQLSFDSWREVGLLGILSFHLSVPPLFAIMPSWVVVSYSRAVRALPAARFISWLCLLLAMNAVDTPLEYWNNRIVKLCSSVNRMYLFKYSMVYKYGHALCTGTIALPVSWINQPLHASIVR